MEKLKLSKRLPKDLSPSPFFEELEKSKGEVLEWSKKGGRPLIDMTISSPVRVGVPVDLENAVDEARGQFGQWYPDAAGWPSARDAVVDYYKSRGGDFSPGQILVTASTSEAYSVLFKTFCDPGDVILTPMPGYPLLDTLAQLEHLECAPYFLKLIREDNKKKLKMSEVNFGDRQSQEAKSFRFVLDTDSLLTVPERARILLLVSPHNPTGHIVSKTEWNEVLHFCEEHNLILVVDEVFGDYGFSDEVRRSFQYGNYRCDEIDDATAARIAAGEMVSTEGPKCPIFWLNGLSKSVGSPQLKLGWMAFYAPKEQFEEIRASLEFVEDAYLSASSCGQALATPLLKQSKEYEQRILQRLQANYNILREKFPSKYCPKVLGGWYAVLHLGEDDEELTLRLLREKQVLVQPGFFFDFEEDGWIVVSLLQEPEIFKEAVGRIVS